MLLRELIEIPEHVHQSDFVLRLGEGVARPRETLGQYVVTEQLRRAFVQAVDLVKKSVEGRHSAAAFLHGSFGSGKSHFMAVLHLLLSGDVEARSMPELAAVVAKLDWAKGRRFLLVPYHLMGVASLEEGILGGYVERVQALHPGAPLPAIYKAEPVFDNARALRATMGDETFFAKLQRGGGQSDPGQSGPGQSHRGERGGWGSFGRGPSGTRSWDAASFEAAAKAPPKDPERAQLVSDVITHLLPALAQTAGGSAEAFVPLDQGLAEISRHAAGLGYDALVLFLDELMLWLASHVSDLAFINREGSKLAKLVEAQAVERPVPIVSLIARQRDLRELVGDHLPGAEKLSFSDTLKWSEGRFERIPLEDRNLPEVAKKRLLSPRDPAARAAIDAAFEEAMRMRPEVRETLLGRTGTQAEFRDVYPFSPALVKTLVAVSSALQRERTALRVMLQLLVEGRDRLRLGDVVPVGDLFDVIASGDEPFTEDMRLHFEQAKALYKTKLRPMLERQHGISLDEVRDQPGSPRAIAFRGHDRLLKTLLLAALTPEVEALRSLTADRLAALNHGSIRSPIPGGEAGMILAAFRQWGAEVGQIRVGDDSRNPVLSIQLSAVEVETLLEKVRGHEDNQGNRKLVVRDLVFQQLGLGAARDDLFQTHAMRWRGTKRLFEVAFTNIRELPNEALRSRGDTWRVVIDYPFDAEGYSARDDVNKVQRFRAEEPDTATFCWVPAFFSRAAQRDLGNFLLCRYLLVGDRLEQEGSHLSAVDRAMARSILENQKSQLEQRLIQALEAAYGVRQDVSELVDSNLALDDRFQSLDQSFKPRPPAAANLQAALAQLLEQILEHRFPNHPRFEVEEVTLRDLRRVLEVIRQALQTPQQRIEVERESRALMRQIAQPLGLGEMHEAAFVVGDRWRGLLAAAVGRAGGRPTVAQLRLALDEPRPLGLPREVQDLVLLVFAEQTNRSFFFGNNPITPELGGLRDELELREQVLPDAATWAEARARAATLFGFTPGEYLMASSVGKLEGEVRAKVEEWRRPAASFLRRLESWLGGMSVEAKGAPRKRTAQALVALLEGLAAAPAGKAIEVLAKARLETSGEAMARSAHRSAALEPFLDGLQLPIFQSLEQIQDQRAEAARALLARVREALQRDELAVDLEAELRPALRDATALLAQAATPAAAAPSHPSAVEAPPAVAEGWGRCGGGHQRAEGREAAASLLERVARELEAEGEEVRLTLDWTIERRTGEP